MKREEIYFEAMEKRDPRFDGKFFFGVKTTGIYCRPVCPARPKRENVEFFRSRANAEKAGYRPCLRCRPETAPFSPAWIGKTAIVRRAEKLLHRRAGLGEENFASIFGVSARHLRRLFVGELGRTAGQLELEKRLCHARQLVTDTARPISEIAFVSGFGSLRRFNDAFKKRFQASPRELRRKKLAKRRKDG
jgi:AraC family transcriptional regulator, regulatory protein of adaptative response / DNA-3-methyladenine glycosylase II